MAEKQQDFAPSAFSGIRARILALALVVLLPAFGLHVHSELSARWAAERQQVLELQTLARYVATDLGKALRSTTHLLLTMAQLPEVRRLDATACGQTVARLLPRFQRYSDITASTREGDTVCAGGTVAGARINVADRSFFRAALDSHDPIFAAPIVGRVSGKVALPVALALRDEADRPYAVLAGFLQLQRFADEIGAALARGGAVLIFLDAEGTIFARYPNDPQFIGKTHPTLSPLLRERDSAFTASGLGPDRAASRRYAAEPVRLGDTRLWVAVALPESEIAAPLDALFRQGLLGFALLAATALTLGWLLAEILVRRPLRRLSEAAGQLRGGNLAARIGRPYAAGELGRLMADFDLTAAKLEAHNNELARHRASLEQQVAERTAELRREVAAHKRAEESLRIAAAYNETQRDALTLFNASCGRQEILDGVLSLLARQHPFPVCAYYDYDEWRGAYVLRAAWGAPAGMAQEVAAGKGLIGQAAQAREVLVIDEIGEETGLAIDAGLLGFTPRAVLLAPVHYQQRRLGVLALAASRTPVPRDLEFVEQLASQLGVALHNLGQHDNLRQLAGQLRKRGEEIARKNIQLEEASRMKSEFLANMSHELRTPLNAIIGFSEILRDGLLGTLAPKQQEPVEDIYASGQHLLSLINDILDLSKIEAGRMTLEPEHLGIASLCMDSLSIVKEKALANRIRLDIDCPDGLPEIAADPRKVKQILYNLLSNAVKFTPDGGTVSLAARRVEAPAAPTAGRYFPPRATDTEFLEITVTDSGIGIDAAGLQKLFEPFVQLDSVASKKYQGTGLGLAMVRRLTELHGGALAVESTPGQGSRFTVWLPYREAGESKAPPGEAAPLATTAAEPAAKAAAAEIRAGRQPMVLIVEDDDKSADLLRAQIEAAGYRAARAASGEQALEMALREPPDAITLDIMLPDMDGWEVLSRLKQNEALAHIPVVIVSIIADAGKGFALGAAEVLQKPVSHEDLTAALARLGLQPSPARPARVLVVDDDPRAVQIIATHLEQAGFGVERAYGGQEAIDTVRGHPPDALILDLMMPEVTGFDVVQALKADPATAAVPIVAVTAKLLTAADRAELAGHVAAVMEKSAFRPDTFMEEVRRAVRATAVENES